MNTNISSNKTKGETTEATYGPVVYATLFTKGLERMVEAGKSSLDSAIEQNTAALISCKKALQTSSLPGLFLFDLAGQVVERYFTLQKSLLHLSVEQSNAVIEAARQCSRIVTTPKAGITNVLQHSVDRTIASKSIVDFAVKQAKEMAAPVKLQPAVIAKPVPVVAHPVQGSVIAMPTKEILMVGIAKPQPAVIAKPVPTVTDPVQRAVTAKPAKETPKIAIVKSQPAVTAKPLPTIEDSVQLRVDTLLAKEIVDLAIKPSKPSGPVN